MCNLKNYKYAFVGVIFLMILANIESKNYQYQISKNVNGITEARSTISFAEKLTNTIDCSVKFCIVYCSGDMTALNAYLKQLKTCQSYALKISNSSFPDNRLQSNLLEGNFKLNLIEIKTSSLSGIDDGAFNHETVAEVTDIELNGVQLPILTEDTFIGLKAVETFALINRIKDFSGDGFLIPMSNTLQKVIIKHVTNIATDPAPWLRGGDYPNLVSIVFDGSNFGDYIKGSTFEHLKGVYIITMISCKISHIADGTFDFLMKKYLFYLSLENNQLKRIGGEYLTKVTSLKVLDLQNNPWDCTCELEDLIREYTRYPGGFGDNVKCRTPPELAGKRLNEVNVQRCEDTTTVLTTISSSTTENVDPSTTSESTTEEEPDSSSGSSNTE